MANEPAEVALTVWRVPEVPGWSPEPAIRCKAASSSVALVLPREATTEEVKEALCRGSESSGVYAALYDDRGAAIDRAVSVRHLAGAGDRVFFELWRSVLVRRVGAPQSAPPCSVRVSVKASAILYDVKTAVLQRFWWKYCDLLLVEVPPPGRVDGFTPCDVWSELGERTEVGATGRLLDELPTFETGEEVEVLLWSGAHQFQPLRAQELAGGRTADAWVGCVIERLSDHGACYDLHVLPTDDHAGADGHAGTSVPLVPRHLLRRSRRRLIQRLREEHFADDLELPEGAPDRWTSEELVAFFESGGVAIRGHATPVALAPARARALLTELRDAYRSARFVAEAETMLRRFPDRTGFVSYAHSEREAAGSDRDGGGGGGAGEATRAVGGGPSPSASLFQYTAFYVRRKQLLLGVQSAIMPKYGFSSHQGGALNMIEVLRPFFGVGHADIDALGAEVNAIIAPLYEVENRAYSV